jgi:uncharacterized protein (TIGR02246 family)
VVVALCLGACTPASPPPAQDAADDLAAIAALRNAYGAAMQAGDATAVGALYTDNGVSQTNAEPTMVGRTAIVDGLNATFQQVSFSNFVITPDETHTMGTTGYERGRYTATVTPKAEGAAPMAQEGRYMILLQKGTDGMWKVTHDMDNTATPPAPAAAPAAPTR